MNAELEEILKAYDAFREAFDDDQATRLEAVYESRLDEVIGRNPRLTKESLRRFIETRYRQWLSAQKEPPTLPRNA